MKLGVLTNLMASTPLEEACAYFEKSGLQAVEIGCGGYPGKAHCDPEVLLNDDAKRQEFVDTLKRHNLHLSALSSHGNMVHPNKQMAAGYDKDLRNAILLAEKLGVDTVVTFSGCPGDCPDSQYPNWVTCPWPEDFLAILDYQWNQVLIPYWKDLVAFANAHGIHKIALEMHPGFCVYNPETLLKLRAAVGPTIGANLDPSHLFWQGVDPIAAIRKLGEAIYFFHAKDTKVDAINTGMDGVLDTKHYGDEIHRAWVFRAVGYGHDEQTWKDIISNLRMVGYDGTISIEHEDSLMSQNEGLQKAIRTLKNCLMFEDKGALTWA